MSCYIDSNNKKDCTGCGACSLVCPQKCISMIEDREGFLYPEIDKEECINCNKCRIACGKSLKNDYITKAFAAYNVSDKERASSTSGGVFTLLCNYIFSTDGVVYGVCYDKDMTVVHKRATNISECMSFKGSKYVRSKFIDSFHDVEKDLKNGKNVLFIGTPCESDGLKKYLGREYEKLLLCDIICHSNPSPKIFKAYVKYLENKYKSKVYNINFRDKSKSWHKPKVKVEFNNKKCIYDNLFFDAFSADLISRPSCNNCKYTSVKRSSDITIADFWGVDKIKPNMDDDKGTSLILINSEKGELVFDLIKKKMIYTSISINDSIKYNHSAPIVEKSGRAEIFDNIDNDKKLLNKLRKYSILYHSKLIISELMPKDLKNKIKKMLRK